MLQHLIQYSLSSFMDIVHSFGYQHMILDGFTLVRIVFIHNFSGVAPHDCFWILSRAYLRLQISCFSRAYPIFIELRRVLSGVVPPRLIVFINLVVLVD